MLLNKQKPIAWFDVAWWPGGRTAQKALLALFASIRLLLIDLLALTGIEKGISQKVRIGFNRVRQQLEFVLFGLFEK